MSTVSVAGDEWPRNCFIGCVYESYGEACRQWGCGMSSVGVACSLWVCLWLQLVCLWPKYVLSGCCVALVGVV